MRRAYFGFRVASVVSSSYSKVFEGCEEKFSVKFWNVREKDIVMVCILMTS